MKLNQKSMLALLLAFCLVLTAIPAFAANVVIQKEGVNVPEEGLTVAITAGGGANGNARLVCGQVTAEQAAALGLTAETPTDFYKGLKLSATFTYKTPPTDGRPTAFSIVNMPVVGSETRDGGKNVLFCVNIEAMLEYSPELAAYKAEHPDYSRGQIFSDAFNTAYAFSNASVRNDGTWGIETYDTGLFPEGTVFISANRFQDYPSSWTMTSYGADPYKYVAYFKDTKLTDGPVQILTAKESGTYNIWVTEYAYPSNLDRNPVINFNGELYNFAAAAVNGVVGTGTWMWAPEKDGKTLTLNAGERLSIQLSQKSGAYARMGTIALVPAEANAAFTEAMTDAERLQNFNTENDYASLQGDALSSYVQQGGASVRVTVNGTERAVSIGTARNRYWNTYKSVDGSKTAYGFCVRLMEDGLFPAYPSVLDAIAADLIEKAATAVNQRVISDIPFLMKNGVIGGYAVQLNGSVVTDLDWTEIKDGDVIKVDVETLENFAPISLDSRIQNSGGKDGADGLNEHEETKNYNYKFVTVDGIASKKQFEWPVDITEVNALKGCYINGYVTYLKDYDATNGDEREMTVFIQDLPVIGSAIKTTGGRLELGTNWSAPSNINLNGVVYSPDNYILPGRIAEGFYDISHLYLTNTESAAKAEVTAKAKGDGVYTISANKSMPIVLLRVVKDEDGKVVSTAMENRILDFTQSGIQVTIGDNETVYVWRGNFLGEGAGKMQPLCEPLTK